MEHIATPVTRYWVKIADLIPTEPTDKTGLVELVPRALADELAAALADLTHEETCDHHWCVTAREVLAKYREVAGG
jgi:cobalamin-dependent methionine synthase I